MAPRYSAGWITVPGKGRRWRTTEGQYLMQRPAGGAPGVMDALRGAWGQADRALGGWLPGGGTANSASGAVRRVMPAAKAVSEAVLGAGVMRPVIERLKQNKDLLMDSAGLLAIPGLGALAVAAKNTAINYGVRPKYNTSTGEPPVKVIADQMNVIKSANKYLGRMGSGISSPLQLAANPSAAGLVGVGDDTLFTGPNYAPGGSSSGLRGVVNTDHGTAPWVVAHEFGHAADHLRRPDAWKLFDKAESLTDAQKSDMRRNARIQALSPGIGVLSLGAQEGPNRDRSLLEAGAEGALTGLASQWDGLSKEAIADIHGRRIAKNAGVRWDERTNLAAKGTYALSAGGGGFVQGVAAELLQRGIDQGGRLINDTVIDPALRSLRGGDSQLESQLRRYGYDPREYTLEAGTRGGGAVSVERRHPLGRFVMNQRGAR